MSSHRRMQGQRGTARACTAAWLLLCCASPAILGMELGEAPPPAPGTAATATATITREATSQPGTDSELLDEVVVRAREPRYAAPTTRDRIGRVWVPVRINGKGPFRLVLDSGATHSAVTAKVAAQLGLSTTDSPPAMMRGVTGSAVTSTIRVRSLEVGDLLVGSSLLPIVDDAFGGAEGLLGTDGLADKRIRIDFRNDSVEIVHSRNRRREFGFETIPLRRDAGRLVMVRATVGNVNARAIIDTGAQTTIANEALRLALRRWLKRNGSRDEIIGATGAMQVGDGLRVQNISLGAVIVRDAHVTFGDMRIFEHWNLIDEPAILIGMDVIGTVDQIIIDYNRREVQIKPPRA